MSDAAIDYTFTMPGFILDEGEADIAAGTFEVTFDPATLHDQFPNLDLTSRGAWESGLADTLSLGLLLRGQRDAEPVHHATTLTIQGDLVLPGTP